MFKNIQNSYIIYIYIIVPYVYRTVSKKITYIYGTKVWFDKHYDEQILNLFVEYFKDAILLFDCLMDIKVFLEERKIQKIPGMN